MEKLRRASLSIAMFLLRTTLVCLLGAVMAAPWLGPNLVWCSWLGTAAALVLSTRVRGWAGLFATGLWALIAIALAFHWSPEVLAYTMESSYATGVWVFVPLMVWDAIRVMLPFWLGGRLARNSTAAWLPAGLIAVTQEAALPSVFPWRIGYSQVAWPWTIQAVDLFGPAWSTFMVFAYAGAILSVGRALYDALRARRLVSFSTRPSIHGVLKSPAIWLCAANLLYSAGAIAYWQQQIDRAPILRVALVQVDPSFVKSADDLRRLTNSVCKRVDLVCWPESSGGTYDSALDRLSDAEQVFGHSRDPNRGLRPWENPACALLLGGKTYRGDREHPDQLFQSAILIDRRERIVGRYHKRYLMPFGEYVPGETWLPVINRLFSVSEVVSWGDEATVLRTGRGARLGVMLCYEDMMPDAARSLSRNSANLLVSLVNGSAFDNPLTLAQHRMLAQLRAVECRRYFLRCAATGETCVVSPTGSIEDRLPIQEQGVLTAEIALLDEQSGYCRLGEIFPLACCLALAVLCIRRKRQGSGEKQEYDLGGTPGRL